MSFSADLTAFAALSRMYEAAVVQPAQQAVASFVVEMYSRLARRTPRVTGWTAKQWTVKGDGQRIPLSDTLTTDADVIEVVLETPYAAKFEDGFGGPGGTESYSKTRIGRVVRRTKKGFVVVRTVSGTALSLQAPQKVVGPVAKTSARLLSVFIKRHAA